MKTILTKGYLLMTTGKCNVKSNLYLCYIHIPVLLNS